jgi:hypothetical protein
VQKHDTKSCRQECASYKGILLYPVHQCRYFAVKQKAGSRVVVDVDAPDFLSEITILDWKKAFPAHLLSLD